MPNRATRAVKFVQRTYKTRACLTIVVASAHDLIPLRTSYAIMMKDGWQLVTAVRVKWIVQATLPKPLRGLDTALTDLPARQLWIAHVSALSQVSLQSGVLALVRDVRR